MSSLLLVGIGGFLGANARYAMTVVVDGLLAPRWGHFPYGTLAVNFSGSFGLALLGVWLGAKTGLSPQLRLLLGTGFFGAFTTFSTFANESAALFRDGMSAAAILNILLNNGLCLLGVALGLLAGSRLAIAA